MAKYLIKRLLHGLFSIVVVVAIVMILIYSLLDRNLVFAADGNFTKKSDNELLTYKNNMWEKYGYVDYVPYSDYLSDLVSEGKIDNEKKSAVYDLKNKSAETQAFIDAFKKEYSSKGYQIVEKAATKGSKPQAPILFAVKDVPVLTRLYRYIINFVHIDNIHYVEETTGEALENTGLTFTLFDPVYNTDSEGNTVKKVISPAIIGTGTEHRYLLYFDSVFPYIHQNLISINLGTSYAISKDKPILDTMFDRQDPDAKQFVTFPTGLTEESPRDLHTATYVKDSFTKAKLELITSRYVDDYTNVKNYKANYSRTGFSFIIGIISVVVAYLIGVPLGILMARKKDKLADKLGTVYIIFIIAVPSLAYIFLFRAIGGAFGLETTFMATAITKTMYIMPVISLAMPSIANLMKWLRRFMIDQMNSDYVRFARSGGLTEGEIFSKHILKNAAVPLVHGIPGSILGAMTGAIITESIYLIPGAGGLLTKAINQYDNGVIVGLTLFYAALSVISIILGDILMSLVDPRISFTEKAR